MRARLEPHRLSSFGTFVLLVGAGVVLRLRELASREAFWSDEAALALNIVDRAWHEVGRPFIHAQVAPYLFVLGEKALVSVVGPSEASLRAWSLLAGVLLLPALFALGRLLYDQRAGFFALAAAASAIPLIHYSTELKPYGTDALISTLVALATVQVLLPSERPTPAMWRLWAVGSIAPWLSLPSVFVLAGSGASLAVAALLDKRRPRYWAVLAAIGCSWAASASLHYLQFLRLSPTDAAFMQRYWSAFDGFAPFPIDSLADLRWYAGKFFYMFAVLVASLGHGERYLAAGLWAGGLWLLFRRHKALPVLAVVPIAVMMGAAAAHAYVLVDRLFLFLTPLLLAPCAIGLSGIARIRPPVSQVAAVALLAALGLQHVLAFAGGRQRPALPRDIRTLVAHLHDRVEGDDRVCVEHRVAWAYQYYARRAGLLGPFEVIQTLEPDEVLARAEFAKLRQLAGAPRVWAVVPTLGPLGPEHAQGAASIVTAEQHMLRGLGALGRRLEVYDATNVRLYLYDLSANASLTSRD